MSTRSGSSLKAQEALEAFYLTQRFVGGVTKKQTHLLLARASGARVGLQELRQGTPENLAHLEARAKLKGQNL